MATETAVEERPPATREEERGPWPPIKKALAYAVLILFALVFIYPFILAVGTSFKALPDIARTPVVPWPSAEFGPTLEGIRMLNTPSIRIPRWAFVSVVMAVTVTLARVFLDSLAGYALARMQFPGRAVVFVSVVAILMIPGVVLLVPRFLVMKQLGIINTWFGLILPLAFDAFGIFMMKQFFEGLPRELEESAVIDGAGPFRTFWNIMLPIAAPGVIALTILSFQASWNDFLHPLIAAPTNVDLRTLPVGLALLRGQFGESQPWHAINAASVLTTIPMAIIFFTFQRYFVQGVAAAGVKG